ncbi:MAG: hypothetical protein JSW71_06555 [Gemmatimonadota bacterium]|nr:MAG: hypothetical protein JSW71_06555 [Gemmatimonadota bacterium]
MYYQRVSIALFALLLSAPCEVLAQRRPDPLESLEVEQLVKLRTVNHGLHIGRVARLTRDTIYLRPQRGSSAVATAAVDELWVRGTATKKGAVIGSILGGALGGLLSAYASYAVCDAARCGVDASLTVIGLATGAAFGAITGAVFGAMAGQWNKEYP